MANYFIKNLPKFDLSTRKNIFPKRFKERRAIEQGVEVWNKWRKENSEVGADLTGAILVKAIFNNATLKDCKVYGISARDIKLDYTK